MLQEYYDKLMQAAENHDYMSIAINADGSPIRGGFVPWETTASAMNMRVPKLTISRDDLKDQEITDALRRCKLIGCYILVPLEDYSFLKDFTELRDLFIMHGENVEDLSFVQNMSGLFMFYLEDAHLPDLKPLVHLFNNNDPLPGKCIGFYHCNIADTSALSDVSFYITELLIWPVKGDDLSRWTQTGRRPATFRFYE